MKTDFQDTTSFISKQDTNVLKGIAILLMLLHHLLIFYSHVSPEKFLGSPLFYGMCFSKMCVAIFVFLSGYGLYKSSQKSCDSLLIGKRFLSDYKIILRHLWKFYKLYWLAFLPLMVINFLFFKQAFHIKEFLLNIIGFSNSYNDTWWYVLQYILLCLAFPFLNGFLTIMHSHKKVTYPVLICAIAFAFILPQTRAVFWPLMDNNRISYLLIFLVGILFSQYPIFEWINAHTKKFAVPFAILLLLFTIIVRSFTVQTFLNHQWDFALTPIFIFAILVLLKAEKVRKCLAFLGKHSLNMWLIHYFIYGVYLPHLFAGIPSYTVAYLMLVLLSLIASVLLTYVDRFLKKALDKAISHKSFNCAG